MNRHHRLHTENKKLNCKEVFFSSRVEPTETNCSESVRVWTSRESGWDLSWWKWPWPCGVKISLRRKPDHFPPHTLHNPTQIFSGEKKTNYTLLAAVQHSRGYSIAIIPPSLGCWSRLQRCPSTKQLLERLSQLGRRDVDFPPHLVMEEDKIKYKPSLSFMRSVGVPIETG